MEELALSLIAVFVAITIIPTVAKKIRLPVVVLELVFGVVIGVSWLNLIPDNSVIEFFSSFGLVYLLFLAGLEVDLSKVRDNLKATLWVSVISLALPFLVGVLVSDFTGIHPLLIGTILSTSSVGIILPLLKQMKVDVRYRNVLLSSVILVEAVSIFLLSFSLGFIEGNLRSTVSAMFMALLMLVVLPWAIRRFKIKQWLDKKITDQTFFNTEVRFAFALILILGAVSNQLGFEGILGAFLAGLILSELKQGERLHEKLDSFGYGFFIPLFFVFTGASIDLKSFFQDIELLKILLLLMATGLAANFLGVFIFSRWQRFSIRQSAAMGMFHATLTSLTIAAAEVASREGVINNDQFSIFVLLALATAIIGPIVGRALLAKYQKQNSLKSDSAEK